MLWTSWNLTLLKTLDAARRTRHSNTLLLMHEILKRHFKYFVFLFLIPSQHHHHHHSNNIPHQNELTFGLLTARPTASRPHIQWCYGFRGCPSSIAAVNAFNATFFIVSLGEFLLQYLQRTQPENPKWKSPDRIPIGELLANYAASFPPGDASIFVANQMLSNEFLEELEAANGDVSSPILDACKQLLVSLHSHQATDIRLCCSVAGALESPLFGHRWTKYSSCQAL